MARISGEISLESIKLGFTHIDGIGIGYSNPIICIQPVFILMTDMTIKPFYLFVEQTRSTREEISLGVQLTTQP